jgi:predicted phage gp36 major capsid-like protein
MYIRRMAIDPDLLSEAKIAEADLIEAEHAAEVARAEFHRAVRRLHLAGASLREIATWLGLSHQRVHQIVESAGGSRRWRSRQRAVEQPACSFCGRDQKHTKVLIGGPGAFICNLCIPRADAALGTEGTTSFTSGRIQAVSAEARAVRCSFCGKCRYQVPGMVAALAIRICTECLDLCHEIRDERLA